MLEIYKKYFAEILSKDIDLPIEEIITQIEIPPENISWDLAFPCFNISKTIKKAPNIIAQELSEKLESDFFSSFENIWGYLNANINQSQFIQDFFQNLNSKDFKSIKKNNSKTKVMIEYMSANPNKPLHIWQARNICVGDSLRRIYEYLGYEVHSFDYEDDSGVNVGYNIVWHLFYDYPLDTDKKYDHYCWEIYEKMRKNDEDINFKKTLSEILIKIEEWHDEKIKKLHFDYTRKCALEQIRTCRSINSFFDGIVWETDILHLKLFAQAMELLKDKWYFKFINSWDAAWCWVIDLSSLSEYSKEEKKYQILIKSDGTATYIAKDIAFAMWKLGYLKNKFSYDIFTKDTRWKNVFTTSQKGSDKKNDFFDYHQAITVIDNRQIPPQKIVQSALKLLWYIKSGKDYLPLGYWVVYLTPKTLLKLKYKLTPEEKVEKRLPFASRKWRTVTIDEMIKMLHDKAYFQAKERNPEKYDDRLDNVANKIAVSALRFFLIRWDIDKDIVFDIDEILDMQWETWAYILYTWARIQSIINNSWDVWKKLNPWNFLTEQIEFDIIKKLSEFDSVILQSQSQLSPHLISRYLFELTKLINTYYAKINILKSQEDFKKARIFLLKNTLEIIQKAMNLIWMEFLEKM